MAELTAFFTSAGVPMTAPTDLPRVTVRRTSDGFLTVNALNMDNVGGGHYAFDFTTFVDGEEYAVEADGDPLSNNGLTATERYKSGFVSGTQLTRLLTDIPAILTDTAAIASLNDLSIADVQTALTNQGYTAARALLLDNIGTLTAAERLAVADAMLLRDVATIEPNTVRNLGRAIQKLVNRFEVNPAGTLATVYRTDDLTTAWTQNVTTDPNADPITGVNTN